MRSIMKYLDPDAIDGVGGDFDADFRLSDFLDGGVLDLDLCLGTSMRDGLRERDLWRRWELPCRSDRGPSSLDRPDSWPLDDFVTSRRRSRRLPRLLDLGRCLWSRRLSLDSPRRASFSCLGFSSVSCAGGLVLKEENLGTLKLVGSDISDSGSSPEMLAAGSWPFLLLIARVFALLSDWAMAST